MKREHEHARNKRLVMLSLFLAGTVAFITGTVILAIKLAEKISSVKQASEGHCHRVSCKPQKAEAAQGEDDGITAFYDSEKDEFISSDKLKS
ncbi:MAG: hypothetical protein RR009_08560, partial [Oscillospiraceae bacterium]